MTILLCPRCLRWQDAEGPCAACGELLDLFTADPPPEELAERIGEWREFIGPADINRIIWPRSAWLHGTSQGLLLIPMLSSVMNPQLTPPADSVAVVRSTSIWSPFRSVIGLIQRCQRTLFGPLRGDERSGLESLPCPADVERMSSLELAELLLSDPGVQFISRSQIVSWRRRWQSWELLRRDARWWPERLIPRGRDVQDRLLHWLENSACVQPTTNS